MRQNIEIKPKMKYQEGTRSSRPLEIFWNLCVLCIFLAGLLDELCVWFAVGSADRQMLFILSGAGGIFTVLLYHVLRKKQYSVILPLAAACGAVVIYGGRHIYYGFFGAVNYLISWWNLKQEDGVRLLMQDKIGVKDIQGFCVVLLFLCMAAFWHMIIKKRLFLVWILPVILILTGCIIDRFSAFGCVAMLTGIFGVWISTIRRDIPGARQLFWLAGIGACLFGAVYLSGDGQMKAAVDARTGMTQSIEKFRYGESTLPKGDLSKADGLLQGSDETLKITTGQVKNIYLRGFVGSRYEHGVWRELPRSAYKGENSGILSWLKGQGLVPQNQYAEYENLDEASGISANELQIENVGADRSYIYLPYSASMAEGSGISAVNDDTYQSDRLFGTRSYTCTEWSGSRPGELLYAASWVGEPQTSAQNTYVNAEKVYASFVYDHYLDVDEQMAQMIQGIFYDGYNWESDEHTIYAVTERIRDVLESRAVYREVPETAPDGTDPVTWFLNKSHEGNAVDFASAAVFAYRVEGIPARYVEGYLAPESEIAASASGTVTLTDKNSHAWVEVYLDGVGWVPVDVTPGFYYDTYTLLQMVQKPQTVSQTAASENSDDSGNALDQNGDQTDANSHSKELKKTIRISLTCIAVLLLCIVIGFTVLEIRHVIKIMLAGKRQQELTADEWTEKLITMIFKMLTAYGYPAEPGFKVTEVDHMLAEERIGSEASDRKKKPVWENCFDKGDYIRVAQLMEKHIYGQETLTDAENHVLYHFAKKLYQMRRHASLWLRIRMRYLPDWQF